MRRLRLLVLLTGVGTLVAGAPMSSAAQPTGPQWTASSQAQALGLLQQAVRAVRTRTWSGTEYVCTRYAGAQSSAVVEVSHTPVSGSVVRLVAAGRGRPDRLAVATDVLDERLLDLLAERYDLRVAGPDRSAGRSARVVEARRRPDTGGAVGDAAGAVAGRFWVDDASALVLRREVYDEAGEQVRSSSFLDLAVVPAAPAATPPYAPVAVVASLAPAGQRLAAADLDDMRQHGWPAPPELPGQLGLYEARLRDQVLQLAYSDGLSTLSVFVQRGAPARGTVRGFAREQQGGATVWAQHASPERVVWSGGGHTWTLLSDASPGTVRAAVRALPHDVASSAHRSALERLGRGLTRLGSWLNPFN